MDIYPSVVEYLSTLQIFDSSLEMKNILQRAASGRPRDWQLPIIVCQAVSDSPERAIPASAALACAQISIILDDDMLDEDPRGEYHRIGYGRAANFASAFQAASVESILGSQRNSKVREEAVNVLNQMLFTTALGQELDVKNPDTEILYWQVVENKSAPFYGCAFALGALFGNASGETTNRLRQLGGIYGEMIQIHDDINDTMAVPANSDWLQGRKPLPILFAQVVDHPEHSRFNELYQNISAGNALQEAQEILIRCGAISYCVDQLLQRCQTAQEIFTKIFLPNPQGIRTLLEDIVTPVEKLLEAMQIKDAESVIVGSKAYPGRSTPTA